MKVEGIKISRETVREKNKMIGTESKVPIEGQILTVEQKEKRFNWCKNFKNKADWVIWTLQKKYSSMAQLENSNG